MVHLGLWKKNVCTSSIRIWHLLSGFAVLSVTVVLAFIPFYIRISHSSKSDPDLGILNMPSTLHQTKEMTLFFIVEIKVYDAEFHIRWFNASPNIYEREILGINDQFPCPRIVVEQGTIINIRVINQLFEETIIHWHGLHQRNTTDMDGVPGVTQCSIMPNQSYVYRFHTANQSGTYWYHSHHAIQYGDGLKGILVIKDPNDPWKSFYDDEEILELTDWYHTPVHIYLVRYLYPGTLEPIPDRALINGIGQFNCTLHENCSYYRVSMDNGKSKRLRIINTSIYARITLTIDQHQMRLIEADGIYLDGNTHVRALRLGPGQRYSVIVSGKENSSDNYWIRATMHPFVNNKLEYNYSNEETVLAILQYNHERTIPSIESFSNDDQLIINQSLIDGEIFSDQPNLVLLNDTRYTLPTNETIKTLIFNFQHKGRRPGYFYLNNHTFIHPINQTFLSFILYNHSEELEWPSTFRLESGQIYDLIINNIDYTSHPFHLHGHHLWILAQGYANESYIYHTNISYPTKPVYRDTVTVNPFSYMIVRFQADNPGIWMMHCHNDWHLQLHMSAVFIESKEMIRHVYSDENRTDSIPLKCQS